MSQKKIVLITGCSRGLGKAMVAGFIDQGWTVAGCARSIGPIDELSAEYGDEHLFQTLDVTEDDAVAEFCEAVVARLGAPDLVLNNAAIVNQNAPLWEVSPEEFSDVIDVNIKGVTNIIRHIVPPMIAHGKDGVIVNFSSGWGRSTASDVAPYCATKWAIEGLSSALAQDLSGTRVAAVALNPGIIDTAMLRKTWGEGAGGFEDAESWAKTAVPFLAGLSRKDNGRALTAP